MKTPEEIKRGLECCSHVDRCHICPYNDDCHIDDSDTCPMHMECYEYIEQLEAQVPRWISVKERQPTKEEAMRCHTVRIYDGRYITQYGAYYSGWEWEYNDGFCWSELYITHWLWMPEIAEPEEE